MGVGIEVLIVDWRRVEGAGPGNQEDLLVEAAFGEVYSDDLFEHGWSWPTQPGEDWWQVRTAEHARLLQAALLGRSPLGPHARLRRAHGARRT